MQSIRYILLGMACFFLASCVTSQSDFDSLRHQMRVMERQQQKDRQDFIQEMEAVQAHLQELDEQISRDEGTVQATQATLWADVQSMQVQVATLSGRLDSLERQHRESSQLGQDHDQILQELKAKTRKLDRSVHMISSQLGIEIAETEPPRERAVPAPPETDAPPVRPDSAQALYQRALDSFYDRDYELAQALWEEFADHFPDHTLTSNAYFWQGESFYQMQDFAQSALAYQEVITNFPDSNKLSASMLKQGMSFFHLGREEAGQLVLNELIRKFPDTAEARRARAFMTDNQ